jgi:hypothetical protein
MRNLLILLGVYTDRIGAVRKKRLAFYISPPATSLERNARAEVGLNTSRASRKNSGGLAGELADRRLPARPMRVSLERKGVAVPATRIVNDEPMCAKCFAGVAIFAFKKIGDTDGDVESGDRKRRYLATNPEARDRKRLRDALWRSRQRALRGGKNRSEPDSN